MNDLVNAARAWQRAIGSENVLTDESPISVVQSATFATKQRVLAIIRPGNREEIQACVQIANQYKTPIYPVSCGKNWGYGSRVPVQDGCVIMELNRLNRIVDYNEKLAYVTVEPGVTFRQLSEYLHERGSNLMVSLTSSTIDSSLIGNTLERGGGRGPYTDRFNYVCGFEVVLPTGECIHTGFERFPDAKAAKVARWGVGPYVDGIFTQSNLGIITQMTLWLAPSPKYFQYILFGTNDVSHLEEILDTLRTLKLAGLRVNFDLSNAIGVLSTIQQYPWKETCGRMPLPSDVLQRMVKRNRLFMWNGAGTLFSASREQGRAERNLIRRALENKVDQLVFVNDTFVRLVPLLRYPFKWLTKIDLGFFADVTYYNNPSRGSTKYSSATAMTYWRKKTPVPVEQNPDRDGCGIIWCMVAAPYDGQHVRTVLKIMEESAEYYQFEANISILGSKERSVDVVLAIIYDRDIPGEDERAMVCHDEMLRKLTEAGYFPPRLGLQSMDSLPPVRDDYAAFLRRLKQALDPNNILAPGRYEF